MDDVAEKVEHSHVIEVELFFSNLSGKVKKEKL